jgi:hypothetical protein
VYTKDIVDVIAPKQLLYFIDILPQRNEQALMQNNQLPRKDDLNCPAWLQLSSLVDMKDKEPKKKKKKKKKNGSYMRFKYCNTINQQVFLIIIKYKLLLY